MHYVSHYPLIKARSSLAGVMAALASMILALQHALFVVKIAP